MRASWWIGLSPSRYPALPRQNRQMFRPTLGSIEFLLLNFGQLLNLNVGHDDAAIGVNVLVDDSERLPVDADVLPEFQSSTACIAAGRASESSSEAALTSRNAACPAHLSRS